MTRFLILSLLLCIALGLEAAEVAKIPAQDDLAVFSGRISKLSAEAALMRIRLEFGNKKFLNKKDRVEFWSDMTPKQRCTAYVIGKSNEYILLRVPNYDLCIMRVGFTTGAYIYFRSEDLKNNIEMAKELVEILLKKRLALGSALKRSKKDLDIYVEKVDAVNKRYDVLKQKLELEWEQELNALAQDKSMALKKHEETQSLLDDVDMKLEKYRINDHNLELDRWALDTEFYSRK